MEQVTEIDAYVPDYYAECTSCGQSPTVVGVAKGKIVYAGRLCGPCTWGDAAAASPDTWN